MRYEHTDNPLFWLIRDSYDLQFVVDPRKGRAVGKDRIEIETSTGIVGVNEFVFPHANGVLDRKTCYRHCWGSTNE